MLQLDTHTLIWLALEPEKLSNRARSAISASTRSGEKITVSILSLWEVAYLVHRGRIQIKVTIEEFLHGVEKKNRILPVTSAIAIQAAKLQRPFPNDPMDRLIAATAIVEDCTLITADRAILDSKACKVLW